MARPPWELIRRALGVRPVLSIEWQGRAPLRIERYFVHVRRQRLPALPVMAMAVHLGGARVSGGSPRGRAAHYIPSAAVLVPPGCVSEWFFGGAIDVAVLYLTDADGMQPRRLLRALPDPTMTFPFADGLVSAATTQLISELSLGAQADHGFVRKLIDVILAQTERVVAGRAGRRISPDRLQLGRLKQSLQSIGEDLGASLSNRELARQAGLSESHFRQVFRQAMGTTPNRYVQHQRLERARELLANTNLPIAGVAAECGFASQSYLTTCFRAAYAVTPTRFRRDAELDAGLNAGVG